MDDLVAFCSRDYFVFLVVLVVSRGMDFLSTWVATPNLALEANPLARRLGWGWGAAVNLVLCIAFALSPLPAIVVATTSVLVAARNFQSAWLMRVLGEEAYRGWMSEQVGQTPIGLYLFCLFSQGILVASVGAVLMLFSDSEEVSFAVGMGIITYAVAVVFYTLLARRRIRRKFQQ
ncbi:MAG: hypothetical protein M1608_07715 [Candidatus Omnitrophica bacterium]|nr:hypothetical protein [Candidatus Omnitrophota bacterium]